MNRLQFRIWKGFLNSIPAIAIQTVVILLAFGVSIQIPSRATEMLSTLMYLFGELLTVFTIACFVQGYIKAGN